MCILEVLLRIQIKIIGQNQSHKNTCDSLRRECGSSLKRKLGSFGVDQVFISRFWLNFSLGLVFKIQKNTNPSRVSEIHENKGIITSGARKRYVYFSDYDLVVHHLSEISDTNFCDGFL